MVMCHGSEVIGEDEEKIDNAGGWDNASCRSGTEFGGGDGYVGGRLVFEATSFENVLDARRVLEIRIGFLQRRDGMIST